MGMDFGMATMTTKDTESGENAGPVEVEGSAPRLTFGSATHVVILNIKVDIMCFTGNEVKVGKEEQDQGRVREGSSCMGSEASNLRVALSGHG